MIRDLCKSDIPKLMKIHEKFFKEEFTFDEFLHGMIYSFVVENEKGEIITAGGVRTLAEMISICDKDKSIFTKRKAYSELLQACSFVANRTGYDSLHAFVQGERWEQAMKTVGFDRTKGQSMFMRLNDHG